jgi:hypothetical protein
MHAALDDAKEIAGRFAVAVVVRMAARGPAHRSFHGLARLLLGGGPRRAVVEGHRNVGAERALHVHRVFGRQRDFAAVDGRAEAHAFLRDLAQRRQAEYLETAGIRQDRPLPVHEAMQPAVRADHLHPRTQHQVEGVAEDDLRA